MTNVLRNAESRIISTRKLLIVVLVLWALLLAVLPFSVFSAQKENSLKALIYCPLSKKLQPVSLPEKGKNKQPFDGICASTRTKDFLYQEIILKTPWKVFTLTAKNFENLVFDYLVQGKAALDKLPHPSNFPSENLVGRVAAGFVSNNRGEHKFAWKYLETVAAFSPNLKPRPPTSDKSRSFPIHQTYQSPQISRRLAPRAPPLS